MYKEKKNDFIAQERREEAHDPNFRSEPHPMPQQTYNPAQLNTSPLSRSQLYAQQQANNPNFRNMSPQMQQQYMNFMNSRANQKNVQNQAGKGCGIAFVVFFFIMFIMVMIGGITNSNYAKDCFAEETSSAVITEQSELLI